MDVDPIRKEVEDNRIQTALVELVVEVEEELGAEEVDLGAEGAITTTMDEVAVVGTTTTTTIAIVIITRDEAVLQTNHLNSNNSNSNNMPLPM